MDDKFEEFHAKLVEWLKENNYYAVLHDGHWGKYFHVRTLDDTCKGLTNEIYGAFLESYECEFNGKGKVVLTLKMHNDFTPTLEWIYRKVVLKEDLPEDRFCEKCGKKLSDKEVYTCAEHTKPIKF